MATAAAGAAAGRKLITHLVAPQNLAFVNVRLVVVGEVVVITELDLDGADLLSVTLRSLTKLAAGNSNAEPPQDGPNGTRKPTWPYQDEGRHPFGRPALVRLRPAHRSATYSAFIPQGVTRNNQLRESVVVFA